MSNHLNEIINRLGYADSIKYKEGGNYNAASLNVQTTKILNDLSPFATYIVNNEPFVVFFDIPLDLEIKKSQHKKIWNAQIPIAIFCSNSTVEIFSGFTLDRESHTLFLAEKLSFNDISESSPFSFWEITSPNFWREHEHSFEGRKLSRELFDNLSFFADRLRSIHNIQFATKLVLRLIFIRYLIDRGVDLDYHGFSSDIVASKAALLSLLDDKYRLYSLFGHLKDRFNGNLFEIESNELDDITDASLKDVYDFLSAKVDSYSGQLSLFDLYDFAIIPVELISSIFEILLEKKNRDKDNAFYTPIYLVDYILSMTIDEHLQENDVCKILDPSCGSGAFLVDSYRRMVQKKLGNMLYVNDNNDELLLNILTENIYGIDLNPHAIDVAIFSLYLAVLDYKNPKTLKKFPLPNLKGVNLIECDFFDDDGLTSLKDVPFDFILGNPPWSNKLGLHVDYCKKTEHKQFLPSINTCRAFILRSKDFCLKNKFTKCCFVLHSKMMLYMQKGASKDFRKFLLTKTKIMHLIELSAVRELVFEGASAPAIILTYSFSGEDVLENRFEYISMKRNDFFKLFKIIVVEKTDIKSVQQKLLLDNDWAWKTLVYGFTGDFNIIRDLKATKRTLRENLSKYQIKTKGTGVQYHEGDGIDASHLLGRELLDSDTAIEHFMLFENNVTKFAKEKIHRPRKKTLFRAPYCLVKKGLDMDDYTMRAVYSEKDFIFHEAVYAIKGELSQKTFLLSAAGLLNSRLYAYFNLMLGSYLGIEREQRQMDEVLLFPFESNEEIARQVEQVQEIKKQYNTFGINTDASAEIEALNQTILNAFGLLDNEFIDYALNVQIPQLTGKSNTNLFQKANEKDLNIYAQYFYNHLQPIFEHANKYVRVSIYPKVARHFSSIEISILDQEPNDRFEVLHDSANRLKTILTELSSHKTNERFYFLKDVLHFGENSFCIIKPNSFKNWHPAIARLDVVEVTDQILSRKNGGKN